MAKSQVIEKKRPAAAVEQVVEATVSSEPTCQHHWRIDSPRGSLSKGTCKRCGEEREFRNSAESYVWDEDSGQGYSPWRGIKSTPKVSHDDNGELAAASGKGATVSLA